MSESPSGIAAINAGETSLEAEHARQLREGIEQKSLLWKLVERPLKALGIEPIRVWNVSSHARDFVHAEVLREIFSARQVDCVFDVGAFNGHFGRFLRGKVGFPGTILSFEPQPGPFRALAEATAGDERWHALPFGLGDKSGEFEMNVMNRLWFSSFLPPSESTPTSMVTGNSIVSTVRARMERIEDRFAELEAQYGFSRPFLKMDTQGLDLQVFAGAGSRIGQFVGLQSEVAVIKIYVGMPDWREALAEYERAGFVLSAFFPVSRDERQRAVELDIVMVRDE